MKKTFQNLHVGDKVLMFDKSTEENGELTVLEMTYSDANPHILRLTMLSSDGNKCVAIVMKTTDLSIISDRIYATTHDVLVEGITRWVGYQIESLQEEKTAIEEKIKHFEELKNTVK